MKANPRALVLAHHRSLVDDRNGKRHWPDYAVFYGLPLLALALGVVFGLSLSPEVSGALLTVTGLLSAFFFGAMLNVTQRALEWAEEKPEQGPSTSWQAEFMTQIAANAGYASLVSITAATLFVVALIAKGPILIWASALGLAVAVHMVLLLLMVMVWMFKITSRKLVDVKTGADATVTHLPKRRAGSHRR